MQCDRRTVSLDDEGVVALLPLVAPNENGEDERDGEASIFSRIERVHARVQANKGNGPNFPSYSCGIGRMAKNLQSIPQSFREAQQEEVQRGCA